MSLTGMASKYLVVTMKTNFLLCPQTCHLVERFDLQILFVVQSNGNRRICNIKKLSRSLIYTSLVSPFYHPYFKITKISVVFQEAY